MHKLNIAIDGPAGAGKSTIAKELARRLDILYLDTGAMYRSVGWYVLSKRRDPKCEEDVLSLLRQIDILIGYVDGKQTTCVNGVDVTGMIRTNEVSAAASDVAVFPAVRLKLVEMQRKIASENDLVVDGRDIGTFVLPEATYKFFLTASAEERANRRYLELCEKGVSRLTRQDILADIIERDKNDSTRAFAPLCKAEDAIEIDTTNLAIEQVLDAIERIVNKQG